MQFSMIAVYIMFRFNPQVNYSSEIISREQGEVCFSLSKNEISFVSLIGLITGIPASAKKDLVACASLIRLISEY